MKNLIINDSYWEQEFAYILKEDIKLLVSKKDMDYVYTFLVPILYSEYETPVCFHYYDKEN